MSAAEELLTEINARLAGWAAEFPIAMLYALDHEPTRDRLRKAISVLLADGIK